MHLYCSRKLVAHSLLLALFVPLISSCGGRYTKTHKIHFEANQKRNSQNADKGEYFITELNHFERDLTKDSLYRVKASLLYNEAQKVINSTEEILKLITREQKLLLKHLDCPVCLTEQKRSYLKWHAVNGESLRSSNSGEYDVSSILDKVNDYRDELANIALHAHAIPHMDDDMEVTVSLVNKSGAQLPIVHDSGMNGEVRSQIRSLTDEMWGEEKEFFIELYETLTFSKGHFAEYSHMEALYHLSNAKSNIIEAFALAQELLHTRLSADEYRYNKIIPMAFGPTEAKRGETVEIYVMLHAYSNSNPTQVTSNLGEVKKTMNGFDIVSVKIDKTTTLEGTVSTMNKDGIRKTTMWNKTITVK